MWMSHVMHVIGETNNTADMCVCVCVCTHVIEWHVGSSDMTHLHVWRENRITLRGSRHTCKWVMSYMSTTHVTRVNECPKKVGCVTSHTYTSRLTQTSPRAAKASQNNYVSFERDLLSNVQTHLTRVNQSRRINCCVTHLRERRSFLVFFWKGTPFQIISRQWINHVTQITRVLLDRDLLSRIRGCDVWLIHTGETIHAYVWHDLFICVTWPIHMQDTGHDLFTHEGGHMTATWHDLITHECGWMWPASKRGWGDSCICVTWRIHVWDM